MDIEQLAQEIAMLKAESESARSEKRLGSFIDRYGTKFNNDTGIANIILAEMDRRGVDGAGAAASDAVQQVLDQLRAEATSVLEMTKGAMTQVSELMDKIGTIDESVQAAYNAEEAPPSPPPPDMGGGMEGVPPDMGGAPPDMGEAPPDMGGGMEGAPTEMGGGEDMGGAPPDMGGGEDMGGAEAAAGGLEQPPPDAPEGSPESALPQEPPPPGMAKGGLMVSDARLKSIKAKFASYAKGGYVKKPTGKAWKPPADILGVLKGRY